MAKSEFLIKDVLPGKLNALVKNIMDQTGVTDPNEAVRLINSGEWRITKTGKVWVKKKDRICLYVTSDGTTGDEWVARLEKKGYQLDEDAKSILLSESFKPTSGIITQIVIVTGKLHNNLFPESIHQHLGVELPNIEVACLMREKLITTDIKEMGFKSLLIMHEPSLQMHEASLRLNIPNYGHFLQGLWTKWNDYKWFPGNGLAYVSSQVKA